MLFRSDLSSTTVTVESSRISEFKSREVFITSHCIRGNNTFSTLEYAGFSELLKRTVIYLKEDKGQPNTLLKRFKKLEDCVWFMSVNFFIYITGVHLDEVKGANRGYRDEYTNSKEQ